MNYSTWASHAVALGLGAALVLAWNLARQRRSRLHAKLVQQAPGILYHTVAREWRCKVRSRADLGLAQEAWQPFAHIVSGLPGVIRVQRLCCGTCLDFRIVVSMRADAYGQWKARDHYPETEVLQALSSSPACSDVQSQLLSMMDCS